MPTACMLYVTEHDGNFIYAWPGTITKFCHACQCNVVTWTSDDSVHFIIHVHDSIAIEHTRAYVLTVIVFSVVCLLLV